MSHDRRRPPFTEVVAALPLPEPDAPLPEPVAGVLAARSWTDPEGTTWTRRGGDLPAGRVRQLLGDASVRAFLVTTEGLHAVEPPDRTALWSDVEPRLRDAPREPGDHRDVRAGEFRTPSGDRLLVVEVRC